MSQVPQQFENVTAICKANIYFEGKVISHAIILPSGEKKTLGLIYAGAYNFGTGAAERMEVIAGTCRVKLAGESEWKSYKTNTYFDVPGNSSYDIVVEEGIMEYVCSYLA